MSKRRILITGASGRIGTTLRRAFADEYDIRSLDRTPNPDDPDAIVADLQDYEALRIAMEGIATLVHLAATPTEAPFIENLVPNNVVGVYHTFEAARAAGVKRIIFASTVQVVTNASKDQTVEIEDPPCPLSLYGATKYLGEVLGRWYNDKHGMEFIGVRIGWFMDPTNAQDVRLLHTNAEMRLLWFSAGDTVRLFRRAIEQENVGFAVVFGTSKTEPEWLSLRTAREILGYEPQDSIVDFPHEA
jgi:nucleoside-diphosphate-sugar epimerase